MIVLAFLLDQIMGVPKDQLPHLGSYNELPALFKSIGDIAFSEFIIPLYYYTFIICPQHF